MNNLHLVHSESPEDAQNRLVWEEIDDRIEVALEAQKEQFTQETLGPFVAAYEARLRKLEEQIPLLTLLQGQQVIIDLLGGMVRKENEDGV